MRPKIYTWLCLLLVWVSLPAWAASPRDADQALSAWQLPEAKRILEELEKKAPDSVETLYLWARYDFYEGNYDQAVERLDQAIATAPRREFQELREIVASTRDVTKNYTKHTSPKGYFEIWLEPGKDEVLLPHAFEALDLAYDAFAEEIGYRPPTPVRVEVYPQTTTLAKVSILTEDDIRTSGTIALCKYNRLMITSPRATLRGYGWVDTLVHEYVHFVVNQKTHNRVPIWMHEGLAKFLERRWRGPDQHMLAPSSEHLLQKRVKANSLITFDQMHPSMAKLPSQEDAALAFAEVYTAMEYLREKAGPDAFERLLDLIAQGRDAQRAFAEVLGVPFQQFEREWKASLKSRKASAFPEESGFEERLVFKEEAESELKQMESPKARDHMHLGEIMQARDRFEAAVIQYQKAERIAGSHNPVLQSRLAHSLLALGRAEEAVSSLESSVEFYPSYVSSWINLGKAYAALSQWDKALEHLNEAARINPFDPEVHSEMARVYKAMGRTEDEAQARRFMTLVSAP